MGQEPFISPEDRQAEIKSDLQYLCDKMEKEEASHSNLIHERNST